MGHIVRDASPWPRGRVPYGWHFVRHDLGSTQLDERHARFLAAIPHRKGQPMLSRIFPRQFDNVYRGHRFGFWFFVPVVLMELSMGTNSLFNTRTVVMLADGSSACCSPCKASWR
jgi:hypothetical protein